MSIGYACLTIGVTNAGLSHLTLKNATKENMRAVIHKNLTALNAMFDYNIKNHITLFRISSDIIPFGSHVNNELRWWEDYKDLLDKLGQKLIQAGIRVSMHPGQYTVLNSPDPKIVENAIRDLEYHDKFLTALGMEESSKLVLHIGGVYGDKQKAIKTFVANYDKLSESIKNRLIIENDDKNYNINDLLSISKITGAPVVFDNLHHKINPPKDIKENISDAEWILRCKDTWKDNDGKQKIHYSQQKPDGTPGSHSDTIILDEFIHYYQELPDKELGIMLEVKDKNISAVKCINGIGLNTDEGALEKEWSRYKYLVLSKSEDSYAEIIHLLQSKVSDISTIRRFYSMVEKALRLPEDNRSEANAVRRIWSYLSEDSSRTEINRYDKLMEAYLKGNGSIQPVKNHLYKCADVRGYEFLTDSFYFHL